MGGQLWEVVGGGEKGGILVREGRDLSSPQLRDRLATGALVEEEELTLDRLHYRRLTGRGPDSGWVSIKLKDKDLLVHARGRGQASGVVEDSTTEDIENRESVGGVGGDGGASDKDSDGAAKVRALLAAAQANLAEELALELLHGQPETTRTAWELRILRVAAVLHPSFVPRRSAERASAALLALPLAEALVKEAPADVAAQLLLGRALCVNGKRKEAEVIWKAAAEHEGPDGEARRFLRSLVVLEDEKARGNVAFKDGKWEIARDAYTRALEADPCRLDREMAAAVLGNRSAAQRKLGDPAAALCDAEESSLLCPGYTKARFRRALALLELERYLEAYEDLKNVKAKDPGIIGVDEWLMRASHWATPGVQSKTNLYAALGVPWDASPEELKKAHKLMSLKWHPDKRPESEKASSEKRFKAIQDAWETLQDEEKREVYDYGRKRPKVSDWSSKPMPKELIRRGFTVRKGDGLTTCMVCGFKAGSEADKQMHTTVKDHPGFYAQRSQ